MEKEVETKEFYIFKEIDFDRENKTPMESYIMMLKNGGWLYPYKSLDDVAKSMVNIAYDKEDPKKSKRTKFFCKFPEFFGDFEIDQNLIPVDPGIGGLYRENLSKEDKVYINQKIAELSLKENIKIKKMLKEGFFD